MRNDVCLRISHLCKGFPGVRALDDVSIEFYKGEELHVKCREVMVCIDSKNRRSTPIPQDLREKMKEFLPEAA